MRERYAEPHETMDTAGLLRRLAPTSRLPAAVIAGAALIATALFFGLHRPEPAYYVTSSDGVLLFINPRTDRAGECHAVDGRMRCSKPDWTYGPLDP